MLLAFWPGKHGYVVCLLTYDILEKRENGYSWSHAGLQGSSVQYWSPYNIVTKYLSKNHLWEKRFSLPHGSRGCSQIVSGRWKSKASWDAGTCEGAEHLPSVSQDMEQEKGPGVKDALQGLQNDSAWKCACPQAWYLWWKERTSSHRLSALSMCTVARLSSHVCIPTQDK